MLEKPRLGLPYCGFFHYPWGLIYTSNYYYSNTVTSDIGDKVTWKSLGQMINGQLWMAKETDVCLWAVCDHRRCIPRQKAFKCQHKGHNISKKVCTTLYQQALLVTCITDNTYPFWCASFVAWFIKFSAFLTSQQSWEYNYNRTVTLCVEQHGYFPQFHVTVKHKNFQPFWCVTKVTSQLSFYFQIQCTGSLQDSICTGSIKQ